jgi:hypothetical protein
MTLKAYERATAILKEKAELEKELCTLRVNMDLNFLYDSDRYVEVSNKLFQLGQEFSSL